jgi:hypothetical protein
VTHRRLSLALAAVAAVPLAAAAEPAPDPDPAPPPRPRRVHGSLGAGGALLATGARGDRARLDATFDVKLGGRFGALAAWRAFDGEHRGLVCAGLVFEAGAARPRLVIDLHAELGADLDARAPLAGGGLRTTIGLAEPLAIILDSGAYLVIDGIAETRLQLQTTAIAALRW